MSPHGLRPRNVSAAALLIGGIAVVLMPQHARSIIQIVIAAAGVSAALWALSVHVPATGWISPLKWMSPFGRTSGDRPPGRAIDELEVIRASLSDRRQRVQGAPPLPPSTLRLLQPLICHALDIDLRDRPSVDRALQHVSPLTGAVLRSEPVDRRRTSWLLRPNPREVAGVVERVLDDLDRMTAGGQDRTRVL